MPDYDYFMDPDAVDGLRLQFANKVNDLEDIKSRILQFADSVEDEVIKSAGGREVAAVIRENLAQVVQTLIDKFDETATELQRAIDLHNDGDNDATSLFTN